MVLYKLYTLSYKIPISSVIDVEISILTHTHTHTHCPLFFTHDIPVLYTPHRVTYSPWRNKIVGCLRYLPTNLYFLSTLGGLVNVDCGFLLISPRHLKISFCWW
jgi:hypothetical protein